MFDDSDEFKDPGAGAPGSNPSEPPFPNREFPTGHYVALVILRASVTGKATGDTAAAAADAGGGAKITRVKLLKPKDTLLLGQVYLLITVQEVTKALRARKHEKMQRCEAIRSSTSKRRGRAERPRPGY